MASGLETDHNIEIYSDRMVNIDDSLAVIKELETDIVINEGCNTQIDVLDMASGLETDHNIEIYSDRMVNIDDSLAVIKELETDIVINEVCNTQIDVLDMASGLETDHNIEIYSDRMVNIDDSLAVIKELETDIVINEVCNTQIDVFYMASGLETDPNIEMYSNKMVNIDDPLAVIKELETDIVINEDCNTQINVFDMASGLETDPDVEMYSDMAELNNLPTVKEIEIDDGGSSEYVVKAKRKLKYEEGDELEWIKNKNKILRMQGKDYKGLKKNEKGNFSFTESRSARQLGKRCDSTFCKKNSSSRKCFFIKDEDREQLFSTFWNIMTWSDRRTYVSTLCHLQPTTVNKTGTNSSRRCSTIKYFLKINNEPLQVCKNMFLQTLGLKEWSVRNWLLKSSSGSGINVSPDYDKKTSKVGRKVVTNKEMTSFFDNLPALPSHYCRSNSNKMYLESFFETKISLFNAYVATLHNKDNAVNKTNFFKEFHRRKLALYSPKKDLCDLCEGYKYGHISQEVYDHHQQRKKDARDAKNLDKQLAMNNPTEYVSVTMDVQAVKLAPFIRASSMYYKTKLCVHNFTVFNQATADVCCYLWDETNAGLEASVFATLILDYLDNIIQRKPTVSNISIYSDGCGYQNRNTTVSNAILKFAIDQKVTVIQNYLEKGHTQMEVDSVHHTIEMKLKKREIYLPTDYINVCKDARSKNPYRDKYLNFSCFSDYSSLKYYTSIRPGYKKGDPTVTDIRCLKYNPDSTIQYKINYDDQWINLPNKNRREQNYTITNLYHEPIKIKEDKFLHLQQLKLVLPKHTWQFYDSIQYTKNKKK